MSSIESPKPKIIAPEHQKLMSEIGERIKKLRLEKEKGLIEMAKEIGADSLAFLSIEGLEKALVHEDSIEVGICKACFTGRYQTEIYPKEIYVSEKEQEHE